jgi:hypothetical protein
MATIYYFLTKTFKQDVPTSGKKTPVNLYDEKEKPSAQIAQAPVNNTTTDFLEIVKQVISHLEGGYYNPSYHLKQAQNPLYSKSGETMFGFDRKAGADLANSPDGILFWNKIDEQQIVKKWYYNYIPPDPLQSELITLAGKMMQPRYEQLLSRGITDTTLQNIIRTTPGLQFNFAYAVWNGEGWFLAFARELQHYYLSNPKVTSQDLVKFFVNRRINNAGLLRPGQVQNQIISKTGSKIKTILKV